MNKTVTVTEKVIIYGNKFITNYTPIGKVEISDGEYSFYDGEVFFIVDNLSDKTCLIYGLKDNDEIWIRYDTILIELRNNDKAILREVPEILFMRDGKVIYKCTAVKSVDMNDNEIEIEGFFMHNILNLGDVLDLEFHYLQTDIDTQEKLGEFVETKRDYVLYRINRDSDVCDIVRSTYKFIR